MKRFKQLGKDTIIYGLGGALAKSIGFFLMPVYTRIFSPADYGTIEMLSILSAFLSTVLVMGMDSAQSFYFFKEKNKGIHAQARVVSAVLQWRLTWGAMCIGLAMLAAPLLNSFFFRGELHWHYFAVAFSASFFSQVMNQSADLFRLLYKPIRYLSITLIHTVVSAGVVLVLILVFDQGIFGFFMGTLSASICAALWGWWQIRAYVDWSAWHKDLWPGLIKFGAPLAPAGFAMYIMNTSDRWFITTFSGPAELGLYAVGAKFAMMIALAVQTFRLSWLPVALDAMHSEDGKSLFRAIGRLYMGLGISGVVILTAISPLLVDWLAAPDYFQSYHMVGVLAWYSIFYGFYVIGSGGIWKAEKTAWSPFLMGIGAGLNIGLNFLLVPQYGSMGAAVATSISYCTWAIISLVVSEKLWCVGFPYWVMLGQILIGVGACFSILTMYDNELSYIHGFGLAVAAVFLLGFSAISKNNMNKIWRKCYAIFHK